MVVPHPEEGPHALLTRPPVSGSRSLLLLRLACVKPAASVRSEPGSNSHVNSALRPEQNAKQTDPGSSQSLFQRSVNAPAKDRQRTLSRLACTSNLEMHRQTKTMSATQRTTPPAHPFHSYLQCQTTKSRGVPRDPAWRAEETCRWPPTRTGLIRNPTQGVKSFVTINLNPAKGDISR